MTWLPMWESFGLLWSYALASHPVETHTCFVPPRFDFITPYQGCAYPVHSPGPSPTFFAQSVPVNLQIWRYGQLPRSLALP